jgi:predicted O-methyltransferase YrrM
MNCGWRRETAGGGLYFVSQAMLPEKLRRLFYSRRLRGPFLPDDGYCWTAHLPEWRHFADSLEAPQRSTLMLYENGVPFLEPHEPHHYIRTEGGGLFSHWQDSLFFSTSDNSDPNTNGRRYTYTVSPQFYRPRHHLNRFVKRQGAVTGLLHYVSQAVLPVKLRRLFYSRRLGGPFPNEGHCWTAHLPEWRHLADSPENPQRSSLMLYEDGVPFLEAHVPHQYIRTEGGGLFSHWQDSLFFSTSDNSDPNTNGRRYTYTVFPDFYRARYCLGGRFLPDEDHCWTAHLPEWHHLADSPENPQRSPLMLYENGVPFLEAHVPHQYIRTEGGGLFSHWQDSLFFSTSDNSDPNTNGRRYTYTVFPEFYSAPTRVWTDYLPTNLSGEMTGSVCHSYMLKRWPRLWYRIEEMRAAYLHPRISEEFFRLYLSEREEHPRYQSMSLATKISMLHEEVLMLLRLFVIVSRGAVLEIGSYIGGATIVLAATAKEFRKGPVISIEPGGAHNHPVIPSADIFSDLVRNVKEAGISEHVKLLNGFSDDSKVVQSVTQTSGGKKIDLLIIDADGDVGRDFSTYLNLLKIGAIIVLDDYVSWCAPEKAQPVKEWVDRAVSEGRLSPLGVWGWGTWIGIYTRHPSKT